MLFILLRHPHFFKLFLLHIVLPMSIYLGDRPKKETNENRLLILRLIYYHNVNIKYGLDLWVLVSGNTNLVNKNIISAIFEVGTCMVRSTVWNHIKEVSNAMISVLSSNAVDRGFEHQSGQAKDYKIGISCFSANHAAFRSKSKDWLALNQDNVS